MIAERSKRVVLEHFTNSADEDSKYADDIIDEVNQQNLYTVIDLQYHMDFPGVDPMNQNNPDPPFYRYLDNEVPEVPYTVIDGGKFSDHRFNFSGLQTEAFENQIRIASLEIPTFEINLDVDWSETGVSCVTTVTSNGLFSEAIQLYVAVIEREINAYTGYNGDQQFNNVVLDMLPTAAGKLLGDNWFPGKVVENTNTWSVAPYVEDFEDLAIIAFVKDRGTDRILQSAVDYESGLVDIRDRKTNMAVLTTYPNPTKDLFYVNLGDRATKDGLLELIDMSGQVIQIDQVPAGYQIIQVNIDHLTPGIYMMRWVESGLFKGMAKIVKAR